MNDTRVWRYRAYTGTLASGGKLMDQYAATEAKLFPHPDLVPADEGWVDSPAKVAQLTPPAGQLIGGPIQPGPNAFSEYPRAQPALDAQQPKNPNEPPAPTAYPASRTRGRPRKKAAD